MTFQTLYLVMLSSSCWIAHSHYSPSLDSCALLKVDGVVEMEWATDMKSSGFGESDPSLELSL